MLEWLPDTSLLIIGLAIVVFVVTLIGLLKKP